MSDTTTTPDYIDLDGSKATITLTNGDKITMREPTVKDLRAANRSSKSSEEVELSLIANLCEVAPPELDALTLRNYARVQEAFKLFTI